MFKKREYQIPTKRVAIDSVDDGCISNIEVVHTKVWRAAFKRVERLLEINTKDYDLAV